MESKTSSADVQEYYGKVLKSKEDLKTSACCSADAQPYYIREIMAQLDDEILSKFYGCGSPIPPALDGCTVLDLGCGTGRDAYVISKLVGENGRVIGVDMTEEQLEVANRHQSSQAEKFGFKKSNIEFKKGYIEDLDKLGIESNSIDVVVSNCVVNLSFNKDKLLKEIFRVLKPGGELYFSDVFTSCRVPQKLIDDPVLIGECISGAFYIEDFRRAMAKVGCMDIRLMASREIDVNDAEIQQKIGQMRLFSQTIRAFKVDSLEDCCEDYGQHASYLGTIPEEPCVFDFDDYHRFEKGLSVPVCGNVADMLKGSRFAKHFKVEGDRSVHYGLFNHFPDMAPTEECCSGGSCC